MKFFRLHKTRRFAVLSLILGFSFYLWKPVSAKQNHAEFSNWLESFVKNQDARNLQLKLDRLSRHSGDLSEVLDLATGIIHEHNDDFELPFGSKSENDADLKEQLISGWQQQQQGGMRAAFFSDGAKTLSILKNDLLPAFGQTGKEIRKPALSTYSTEFKKLRISPFSTLSPLESGIAIGAP